MVAGDLKAHLSKASSSVVEHSESQGKEENALEVNVLSVTDPTLNSTTPVRLSAQLPIRLLNERVVVQRTSHLSSLEPGSDLETLGGRDGHHGVSEFGLELVEDGFAESDGGTADDAGDGATDGVGVRLRLNDAL
jgi:hypothetical protein